MIVTRFVILSLLCIGVIGATVQTSLSAPVKITDPRTPREYHNRGNIFMAQREYSKALSDFNSALTLDPGYVRSYISRGTLHSMRQQIVMAKADFNKALKLDPENVSALYSRAGLYKMEGRFHDALADYQRILEIDSQHKKTHEAMVLMRSVFRR